MLSWHLKELSGGDSLRVTRQREMSRGFEKGRIFWKKKGYFVTEEFPWRTFMTGNYSQGNCVRRVHVSPIHRTSLFSPVVMIWATLVNTQKYIPKAAFHWLYTISLALSKCKKVGTTSVITILCSVRITAGSVKPICLLEAWWEIWDKTTSRLSNYCQTTCDDLKQNKRFEMVGNCSIVLSCSVLWMGLEWRHPHGLLDWN